MGLFDTIYFIDDYNLKCLSCKKKIQFPSTNDSLGDKGSMQTKDLDPCLFSYLIKDGKIFRITDEVVEKDEKKKFFLNNRVLKECDYVHQYIEAYKRCEACHRWINVKFKFTDGRLTEVKLVP